MFHPWLIFETAVWKESCQFSTMANKPLSKHGSHKLLSHGQENTSLMNIVLFWMDCLMWLSTVIYVKLREKKQEKTRELGNPQGSVRKSKVVSIGCRQRKKRNNLFHIYTKEHKIPIPTTSDNTLRGYSVSSRGGRWRTEEGKGKQNGWTDGCKCKHMLN